MPDYGTSLRPGSSGGLTVQPCSESRSVSGGCRQTARFPWIMDGARVREFFLSFSFLGRVSRSHTRSLTPLKYTHRSRSLACSSRAISSAAQRPSVQVGENTKYGHTRRDRLEHLKKRAYGCCTATPLVQSQGQVLAASVSRLKLQDTRSSPELWPSAT